MIRYRVRARLGSISYYLAIHRFTLAGRDTLNTVALKWTRDRDGAFRTDIESAHMLACRAIRECGIGIRVWIDRVTVRR